jgi:hypothetical protein
MNRRFRTVRAGSRYTYQPVLLDMVSPANVGLKSGEVVTVVNLPGCPRANVMGHCHVTRADGTFGGLVVTNSLVPMRSRVEQSRRARRSARTRQR